MKKSGSKRNTGASRVAQISEDIGRELGRLAEATETGKLDRQELKRAIDELSRGFNDMRGEFRAMNQTMQSTGAIIAALTADQCGQRLKVLEDKATHYDRVLGQANTFIWKVAGWLLTAAAIGAATSKMAEHLRF